MDPSAPPVVAVVLADHAGPPLQAVLAAISAQDYPTLRALVIDAGSDDDVAATAAAVAPDALVLRFAAGTGLLGAANDVRRLVEGAAFYLFVASGVVLETAAITALVEEAYRSNAGVVGPKILDPNDPSRIYDVGAAIDKFAVAAPFAEVGERDQEQHDGVRDVFSLLGAALLVRADLFSALDGFDASLTPDAAVLDFCWRAHLVGARVMVVPAARAHLRGDVPHRNLNPTDRLRLLRRLYSPGHLARVLPQLALLTLWRASMAVVRGRFAEAWRELAAWPLAFRDRRSARTARARLKHIRIVPDGDIRGLQVRGSARFSAFVRGHVTTPGERRISGLGRGFLSLLRGGRSWRVLLTWTAIVVVLLIGSRQLITSGIPVVGELAPIRESAIDLVRSWAHGWREVGLGTSSAAPTAFALLSIVIVVCFGAASFARTVLLVGSLVLGVAGAWRLTRRVGSQRGRLLGVLAYAAAPVGVNALWRGSLSGIVAYAIAPWLLARLARAGRFEPFADPAITLTREVVGLGLLLAVGIAFAPALPIVVAGILAALIVAVPFAGEGRAVARAVVVAVGGVVVGVALNLPWIADLYRSNAAWAPVGGVPLADGPGPRLEAILGLRSGPIGGGVVLGLALAALIAVLVAQAWRFKWAARGSLLAGGFIALAWLDGRDALPKPFHAPELFLAMAATGIALAVAMGGAAVDADLRSARVSWRQPLAFVASVATIVATVPMLIGAGDGRWQLPTSDFDRTFSFLATDAGQGGFRVLWIGDPRALPTRGWWLSDGLAYALSQNGPPALDDVWPGTPSKATGLVRDAVALAGQGRTNRLGRLLGPMAVRYVVVPVRTAPAASRGRAYPVPATLTTALESQLDLRRVAIDDALVVYENTSWIPAFAGLAAPAISASEESGFALLAVTDLSGSKAVLPSVGPTSARGPVASGSTILLSEASSSGWHLSVGGTNVARRRAFGWANVFTPAASGTARLSYRTPATRRLAVLAQFAGWILAVVVVINSMRAARRLRGMPDGPMAESAEWVESLEPTAWEPQSESVVPVEPADTVPADDAVEAVETGAALGTVPPESPETGGGDESTALRWADDASDGEA